jgi:uncharacterized membrane protein YfhO
VEGAGPLEPCRLSSPRPEEVIVECDSRSGGYAVLLDEMLPGWTATRDGAPVPILVADGLFRAVGVGPGPHHIVFRYRAPGLRLGALVSLLSALALIAAVIAARRGTAAGAIRAAPTGA